MFSTAETRATVLAYIKNHYFAGERQIAKATGLTIAEVGDALVDLERTDPDVVERDSVIGYIGSTDRIG